MCISTLFNLRGKSGSIGFKSLGNFEEWNWISDLIIYIIGPKTYCIGENGFVFPYISTKTYTYNIYNIIHLEIDIHHLEKILIFF